MKMLKSSVYKPKYHSFSIDSLVGNNKSDPNYNNAQSNYSISPPPSSPPQSSPPPSSPPQSSPPPSSSETETSSPPLEDHSQILNHHQNGQILRSYMISQYNPNVGSQQQYQYNNSYFKPMYRPIIIHRQIPRQTPMIKPYQSPCFLNQSPVRYVPNNRFQPFVPQYINRNVKLSHYYDYNRTQSQLNFVASSSSELCPPVMPSLSYRKHKRIRTAFTPSQLLRLEDVFEKNRYVVGCERKYLAKELNLSETQIKVWFQNRRTKHKREKHQQMHHDDYIDCSSPSPVPSPSSSSMYSA